jgi:hypothetical protein
VADAYLTFGATAPENPGLSAPPQPRLAGSPPTKDLALVAPRPARQRHSRQAHAAPDPNGRTWAGTEWSHYSLDACSPNVAPMCTMKRRKPKAARKDSQIRIRLTRDQKETLRLAADRAGLDVSSWLRALGLGAAEAKRPSAS